MTTIKLIYDYNAIGVPMGWDQMTTIKIAYEDFLPSVMKSPV